MQVILCYWVSVFTILKKKKREELNDICTHTALGTAPKHSWGAIKNSVYYYSERQIQNTRALGIILPTSFIPLTNSNYSKPLWFLKHWVVNSQEEFFENILNLIKGFYKYFPKQNGSGKGTLLFHHLLNIIQ